MSASEWDEVKKLAADFQRTQASSSLQRLSERNCIDVVKKLISLNMIEVLFTSDGKEYITPEHLMREMGDELIISGGRVHLTELASALNVDYSHIHTKASELARDSSGDISLVLGQLISSEYKDRLAEEIDQKLSETGVVSVSDLSKNYDLPGQFMDAVLNETLGTSIRGVRDPTDQRTIFTESYINQYKSKLRGILLAATHPVSLNQLLVRYQLPEQISLNCIEALVSEGVLKGTFHSGSRIFTPDIFSRSQKEYVDNFYKQNLYLDYSTVSKLGITEPRTFCASRFPDSVSLKTCCVSQSFVSQLDATIEECISSKTFAEIGAIIPSLLTEQDISLLITRCLAENSGLQAARLMSGNVFVSEALISGIQSQLEQSLRKKAVEDLESGKLFAFFASKNAAREVPVEDTKSSKKEERKKKAAGKSNTGGGTQGREVKIKNTKKKYKPGQKGRPDDDSDEEETQNRSGDAPSQLTFLSKEELISSITACEPELQELSGEVIVDIADCLFHVMNDKYLAVARQVFVDNSASAAASKKKTHADLQQQLGSLYSSIHLFLRGLDSVIDPLRSQLLKYLQKSLCTDAFNLLLSYYSPDNNPNLQTADSRAKVIACLEADVRDCLTQLSAKLSASSLDGFLEQVEEVASKCDIMLKPIEKKREKNLLSENKQNLILQLQEAEDSGLTLHLSVLMIFQSITGSAIHASGKFVPQIVQQMRDRIDSQTLELITRFEELVVSRVRASKQETSDSDELSQIDSQLQQLQPRIKETALTFKAQ